MRYTNFGSFVQINEFTNEMRKVEIEDAPANTIIAHSLSLHATPATSPLSAGASQVATEAVPVRGEAGLLRAGEATPLLG